jgi:hypothetical protein
MKKFWTYIKHQRKDNSGAPSLKLNGKLYCNPTTKSNILNQQFKSAFSQRTTFTSNDFADSHRMPDADYPIMPDFKFTSNGIEKLLKGLNAHKAPGPDNLSPGLLKELSSEIAPLLQLVLPEVSRHQLCTGRLAQSKCYTYLQKGTKVSCRKLPPSLTYLGLLQDNGTRVGE